MKCKHCGKVISDIMTFCPYCGSSIEGDRREMNSDMDMIEKIIQLYRNDKYKDILDYAIQGDVIAKCYYIRYVMYRAEQSQLSNDEEFVNTLKRSIEAGAIFAKAALGIYKFYHGKRGAFGITDDSAMNYGRELIEESAALDEPAAMSVFAEWLLKGDGVDKDEFAAYRMMKSAAEKGYPTAMYKLGLWHCQGIGGISKNEELGNDFIEKAAFGGDSDAKKYVNKNDKEWHASELGYAISEEDMQNTVSLISSTSSKEPIWNIDDNVPFQTEYEDCQCKEDYIKLYKLIRDEHSGDESAKDVFYLLHLLISNIIGYSLDEISLDDAEAAIDTEKKIKDLTSRYQCPQHYLHFKEDLKTLEINVTDEDLPKMLKIVSNDIWSKYKKEIDEYTSYYKAMKEAKSANYGCFIILCIIAAIIGIMIFPIAAWIACGFILLSLIVMNRNKSNFKKISKTNRESYLLINELIGYGYTSLIYWDIDAEYNAKEFYNNTIPSVLDANCDVKNNQGE